MVIVVAAVVREQGKILLTRRLAGSHLPGYWEFPGGKLEQGESPEEALRRECLEECGIELDVQGILDVVFHRYPEKDVLLLFYACRRLSGQVQDLAVAEHVWVTAAELGAYQLPPPDMNLIEKLQRS